MTGRLVDRSAAKARGAVAGMIIPGIIGLIVLMAAPFAVGYFVGRSSGRRSRPQHRSDSA